MDGYTERNDKRLIYYWIYYYVGISCRQWIEPAVIRHRNNTNELEPNVPAFRIYLNIAIERCVTFSTFRNKLSRIHNLLRLLFNYNLVFQFFTRCHIYIYIETILLIFIFIIYRNKSWLFSSTFYKNSNRTIFYILEIVVIIVQILKKFSSSFMGTKRWMSCWKSQ